MIFETERLYLRCLTLDDFDSLCHTLRDTNTPSQNVARCNGMAVADTWTKHYRGVDMPHLRYAVRR